MFFYASKIVWFFFAAVRRADPALRTGFLALLARPDGAGIRLLLATVLIYAVGGPFAARPTP